jgi:CBS domain-containing protein
MDDARRGTLMRAGDLATPFPTVTADTAAVQVARLLAEQDLPGLIVVDDRGRPSTIPPGTQVLRMAVPRYCRDDPALARVVDEAAADVFLDGLGARTVAEVLPQQPRELPVVDPDATVLEIAAVMARTRTPLVAVTLDVLLDRPVGS